MKLIRIIFILLLMAFLTPFAFTQSETRLERNARMKWWRDARFGMFIHWGLYSIPAGEWDGKTGYGEWIRTSAQIPLDTYDKFVRQFNPVEFNAGEWVRMAKAAGMKYIVITSKHHDGFCMFDTKQTSFNIMSTPFAKDPMKELADACRREGIKLCFYYSIMDWHHPDYLPRREWEKDRSTDGANYDRYVEYMKAELKELLTNYGDIGVFWFDGQWENTWNDTRGKDLYDYVKSLQPKILINNRVGSGRLDLEGLTKESAFGGDFVTPEQQIPAISLPKVDWETCMTMNDHWGYNKNDKAFKTSKEMIRMLADVSSKGGNYLLNVGPTALGTFPQESIDRLKQIGQWMKVNGEAIYGTQAGPFNNLEWGKCTRKQTDKGEILYLHVFDWPKDGKIILSGIQNKSVKAWLLTDVKKRISIDRKDDALILSLLPTAADTINTVIALELKGKLDLIEPPVIRADFNVLIDSMKVKILSGRKNLEVRFEFDGSEPTMSSQKYNPDQPIMIKGTCVISARCFLDGKPVSGTSRNRFTQIIPYVSKNVKDLNPGIRFKYYEGSWDSIPKFAKLSPVKEGITSEFTLVPRNREEHFGFVWSGYIQIPVHGVYAFFTESDDGSKLYIDEKLVVDNDGLHSMQEKEGVMGLRKGFHKIRVEYFEATGSDDLKVYIRSAGKPKMKLPSAWLFQ